MKVAQVFDSNEIDSVESFQKNCRKNHSRYSNIQYNYSFHQVDEFSPNKRVHFFFTELHCNKIVLNAICRFQANGAADYEIITTTFVLRMCTNAI